MFQWWLDLPAWLRIGLSLILLGIGAVIVLMEVFTPDDAMIPREKRAIIVGFMFIGVGCAMLAAGTKSQSERNGYRF
jgi:hypothetical protein